MGWDPWSKKRVDYLSFIVGKGVVKDIYWSAQNAALFIDLLWNIFWVEISWETKTCLRRISDDIVKNGVGFLSNFIKVVPNLLILYIRNLKYAHLTPIFRQHNIHYLSFTCQHKYKLILCTEKPVLNASFKDLWWSNINNHLFCFEKKRC